MYDALDQFLATSFSDDFWEIEGLVHAESLIDNFTEPDWGKTDGGNLSQADGLGCSMRGIIG